jgi:hypothetical protein
LGFALITTAVFSGTAPAAAYLSLTPQIEVQATVGTNETLAIHEIAEFVGGNTGAGQKPADVEKTTDVTGLNDNSASDPVSTAVQVSATTRSL